MQPYLINAINDGLSTIYKVSNHGIPESTIERTLSAAQRFFSLPLPAKQELDIHKSQNFKGYTGLLGENTDWENGKGDLHEGFDIGWEEAEGANEGDGSKKEEKHAMTGQNVWPEGEGMQEFRRDVLEY